jgi:glycosyltransferase involved in cell wall biosynthesis
VRNATWRRVRQRIEGVLSRFARPYTRLSVRSDESGWVLDHEAREIAALARRLGIAAAVDRGLDPRARQCWHFTSQFALLTPAWHAEQRISVDLLHGEPSAEPGFAQIHKNLKARHDAIARLRVSHSRMEALALESGIEAAKVHRIPLGVRLEYFPLQSAEGRREARARLGLPADAVVVGSFQKDGVGWGEGATPKLVKGPDVLLKALSILKAKVADLHVLLTGPARGYVRRGLEALQIPVRHVEVPSYSEIGRCFAALDAYIVSSRDEGGPKAVLEAMASGIPLVTTRVGQAADLVRHLQNGWMTEPGDAEGLAHWTEQALSDAAARAAAVRAGRATAEANSYEAQQRLWAAFFQGYVEHR